MHYRKRLWSTFVVPLYSLSTNEQKYWAAKIIFYRMLYSKRFLTFITFGLRSVLQYRGQHFPGDYGNPTPAVALCCCQALPVKRVGLPHLWRIWNYDELEPMEKNMCIGIELNVLTRTASTFRKGLNSSKKVQNIVSWLEYSISNSHDLILTLLENL